MKVEHQSSIYSANNINKINIQNSQSANIGELLSPCQIEGKDPIINVAEIPNDPIDVNSLTPEFFSHLKTSDNPKHYDEVLARAKPIIPMINKYAKENGIPPALVMSFIDKETNFVSEATNSSGATGLMQFMPSTAKGYFTEKEKKQLGLDKLSGEKLEAKVKEILLEPEWSVKLGCRCLKDLSDKKDGDILSMYTAYTGTARCYSVLQESLQVHVTAKEKRIQAETDARRAKIEKDLHFENKVDNTEVKNNRQIFKLKP